MNDNGPPVPCRECERLRNDYEAALFAHVRAESQLEIASFTQDRKARSRIITEVEISRSKRSASRGALREHAEKSHGTMSRGA